MVRKDSIYSVREFEPWESECLTVRKSGSCHRYRNGTDHVILSGIGRATGKRVYSGKVGRMQFK